MMRPMPSLRNLSAGLATLAVGAAAVVVGSSAAAHDQHAGHHQGSGKAVTAHASRTVTVQVVDHAFKPSKLSIKRGTTVKWVWKGRSKHNARAAKGPTKFDSGLKLKGSYKRKLTKKGSYLIVCDPHLPHMKMTIRVK